MGLFGAIVRTTVNASLLPVKVVQDVVMLGADASDGDLPGKRTREQIETIKREADEDND